MESNPEKLHLFLLILLFTSLYSSSTAAVTLQSSFPKEALPTKSGYLTVNSTTNSAIFYTYYEAQKPRMNLSETPIIIWLQGGPGCSSMLGNFYELGPFRVSSSLRQNVEHLSLEPNPGSWNRVFGVLFLDNPIGTGFSIASSPEEIPRNQHDVAKHLFIATRKFVSLDKLFENRPIYLTGESYAGKYVPGFGYYTLKKNEGLPKSLRLNLAGVAIGNGLTDPEAQVGTHAVNAYYSGLINEKQKTQLEKLQMEAIRLTKNGNWSEATSARLRVLNTLSNMTGLATLYDFRKLKPYEDELVAKFLSNVEIKRALNARESIIFDICSDLVGKVLHEDVMKSVRYMVEFLVKNTKVLLYQGQCDLRDGVVSTEAWMKKMKWEGIGKFLEAERYVWRVNDELAGYMQKWENLTHVVVMNAGHLVPTDQAVNSQAMIEGWVLEKELFATRVKQKPNNMGRRNSLTREVLTDILSRLLVWSLLRFKCVSKFWNSLINDTYFRMKHYIHSRSDQNSQKNLITESFYNENDLYNFSTSSLSMVQVVEDQQKLDWPSSCKPKNVIHCSCDGLVLILVSSRGLYKSSERLYEELLLWNPSTRESILLPHLEFRGEYYVCGMGYDATSKDYKILAINLNADDSFNTSIELLSLKSGSWRRIGYPTVIQCVMGFEDCGMDYLAFVHGAFHWLGKLHSEYYTTGSFNISNEMYEEVPLLEQMYDLCPCYQFIDHGVSVLRGMLCFYSTYNYWAEDTDCIFKLWVMKDYGVMKSWTNFIKLRDTNLFHSIRPKYMFADCEVLLHCKRLECICSKFITSRGPFRRLSLQCSCVTIKQGIVYAEIFVSPKSLTIM